MKQTKGLTGLRYDRHNIPSGNQYPFNLPVLKSLDTLSFHPKVTYFSGENGMGKSTLIEAIATAYGFNPEGGSRNFNFSTRASHSALHQFISLRKSVKHRDGYFLRSESFFNVATNIDKLDKQKLGRRIVDSYGGRSLHEQSHGESFWSLFMHRFGGDGLYILDEPEAALSPGRQMAMLARMHHLIQQDSQFIIATHSPIVMAYPDSLIYEITDAGIQPTSYTKTENYQVSHRFINDHETMVKLLLQHD